MHPLDYAVLGLYLLAMLLIGVYFSREQRTSRDFFLAGRSMGWFPVGLSLMAFYQDHPEAMRPQWVASVDNATRASVADPTGGQPLLDWNEPITPDTVDRLVAEGRLLRPNTKEPFTSAGELVTIDPETGEERIDTARLAMRSPPRGELQIGEIVLHRRAKDELLPRFIATQLPWGAAGLIVAALLAASMSSIDSGLNSIATLLIADYHRRLGWGRKWLARRLRKTPDQLNEGDELRLAGRWCC